MSDEPPERRNIALVPKHWLDLDTHNDKQSSNRTSERERNSWREQGDFSLKAIAIPTRVAIFFLLQVILIFGTLRTRSRNNRPAPSSAGRQVRWLDWGRSCHARHPSC